MKSTTRIILGALTLGVSAMMLMAQGAGNLSRPPRNGEWDGPEGRGPGGPGHRPPPPIIAVLDANHDGVIDAAEIANASNALLTLDADGDGELTPDEFHPPRPGGGPGGPPEGGPERN